MNTINLSVEQIKRLVRTLDESQFSTSEAAIHNIIFKLNDYARPLNIGFAVPAPTQIPPAAPGSLATVWGSAPTFPVAPNSEPQPFSENESHLIDDAIMSFGLAVMELRKDRDHDKITGDSFLQAFKRMRDFQKNRIWEIVRGCIGYTDEQRELTLIVERCEDAELSSEHKGYKRALVDRLVSEGRIFAARTETTPEGKTVSWYRAKKA